MKHSEYALIFDPTLNPLARNLYLALRYCVDYKTGIAKVSTTKLASLISYEPKARSGDSAIQPTRKQIRVWLANLEQTGLIQLHQAGENNGLASWFLPLVMAEKAAEKTELTGAAEIEASGAATNPVVVRVVEQTGAAEKELTGAAPGPHQGRAPGPQQTQENQGFQSQQGPANFGDRGHISVLSDKDQYIWDTHASSFEGEIEGGLNATQISLDNQFILAARTVGQTLPLEELTLIFIDFQNNKHNRHKHQGRADWLADWRSWCAKSKLYHSRSLTNATNKQHYGNRAKPVSKADASRNVFEFARAAAAKLAASED